jgi:hypothetical protein
VKGLAQDPKIQRLTDDLAILVRRENHSIERATAKWDPAKLFLRRWRLSERQSPLGGKFAESDIRNSRTSGSGPSW